MAANESAGIAACKAYAEAQDVYRRTDWNADGILEYAKTITGANSLFEKTLGTGDVTLVDAAFAGAEGIPGTATPKAGYVFAILTGQGAGAPGGVKSYLTGAAPGNMTLGYALSAVPASWDGTGRNSFQINNTGTVYQQDTGVSVHLVTYDPNPVGAPRWVVTE